jgi:hypothetical protein
MYIRSLTHFQLGSSEVDVLHLQVACPTFWSHHVALLPKRLTALALNSSSHHNEFRDPFHDIHAQQRNSTTHDSARSFRFLQTSEERKSNLQTCLTNLSGTPDPEPTERVLVLGMFGIPLKFPWRLYLGIWFGWNTGEIILANTFVTLKPSLHTQGWSYPQVWIEHLQTVLQRKGRRYWIRQGMRPASSIPTGHLARGQISNSML